MGNACRALKGCHLVPKSNICEIPKQVKVLNVKYLINRKLLQTYATYLQSFQQSIACIEMPINPSYHDIQDLQGNYAA